MTADSLILGWTPRQWSTAVAWYERHGATAPALDDMAAYVTVRHEWQKYKGVRLP